MNKRIATSVLVTLLFIFLFVSFTSSAEEQYKLNAYSNIENSGVFMVDSFDGSYWLCADDENGTFSHWEVKGSVEFVDGDAHEKTITVMPHSNSEIIAIYENDSIDSPKTGKDDAPYITFIVCFVAWLVYLFI